MLALLAALSSANAATPALSVQAAAALSNTSVFVMVSAASAIPAAALACCADEDHRLARPGERWAPSDVRFAGSALARHRLIWMAQGAELTVVHFEQGGMAHTYHVVVMRTNSRLGEDPVLWRATGPHVADYAQFVLALGNHAFAG